MPEPADATLRRGEVLGRAPTDLRHRLHEHPELGNDLPLTRQQVLAALEGLGLEITLGEATSSVTAHTAMTSAAIASRCPASESTTLAPRSRVACTLMFGVSFGITMWARKPNTAAA